MLELSPRNEASRRHRVSRRLAIVCSIAFHLLLAIILWSIVIAARSHISMMLTAAAPASTGDVPLVVTESLGGADPVELTGTEPAVLTGVELETLISHAMASPIHASDVSVDMSPPSIDFFGTRAYGNRFVFVLDISYSMKAREGGRFRRACEELIRSVSALRPGQQYYVFLFCWATEELYYDPDVKYVDVRPGHAERLAEWIKDVSLGAGTDPRRALSLAHRMQPDAVFLLSDGQFNKPSTPTSETGWIDAHDERFNANVLSGVRRMYRDIPIHTIAFENPFTLAAMQEIAKSTGGEFRYVPTPSLEPVDSDRFEEILREIASRKRIAKSQQQEFLTRISFARELIGNGELVYAEYVLRPVRQADPSLVANPTMLKLLTDILDSELGDVRLEDYMNPPELP